MLTSNKNKKKILAHSNPKPIHLADFLSFDNIWKLAILAFMVASLYLQNNFITKAEFNKTEENKNIWKDFLKKLRRKISS